MEKQTLLHAERVTKRYGNHTAVNNISVKIKKGEVVGFLGPNGAGKSTTMKMLSGNLALDEGQITINEIDLIDHPKKAKHHIGYLPETPPLYKELTVKEFLRFCARINSIPTKEQAKAVKHVIERCGLNDVQNRLIMHLSKGYQQRVGIAQAIIHSPAVVILDEPTSGLDPIQIREIRQLIREVATEHSVILSTHILPEVQMLCDRVLILSQGQLLFDDTIEQLNVEMQTTTLLLDFKTPPAIEEIESIEGVESCTFSSATRVRVHYQTQLNPTANILAKTVSQNWPLVMLAPEQHSLEEVFMKVIQKEVDHV